MLKTHSETVAVGVGDVDSRGIQAVPVDQAGAVVKIGSLEAFLLYGPVAVVINIVAAELHLVVEEVPGTVEAGHPGAGDSVAAAPAALASAHTASAAAHSLHHVACKVAEAPVVGVVAIEDETDLAAFRELTDEGSALIAPVAGVVGKGRPRVLEDIVAASDRDIAYQAVHHALLDSEVYDRFLVAVVDSRELRLLGLLADDLHLVDHLGRDVLGGKLGIVEEEGLPVNCDFRDALTVVSDGTVLGHLDARKLLQKVSQDIVVRRLERGRIELDSVLLYYYGVAGRSHGRSIEHLLVKFHLDGAEVKVALHLYLLGEWLVTKQLGLEGVFARGHLLDGHRSFGAAQGVFVGFGVSGLGNRHGREADGFVRRSVLQQDFEGT